MAEWQEELPQVIHPAAELHKRVLVLHAALAKVMKPGLAAQALTGAEFEMLVDLRRRGVPYELKPHQMARSLMLSTGGTTNVANRLVARGLIERRRDPDDARSSWLRLTAAGKELAEEALLVATNTDVATLGRAPADVLDDAHSALRALFAACPELFDQP